MSTGRKKNSRVVPNHPDYKLFCKMLKTVRSDDNDCLIWPHWFNSDGYAIIRQRGGRKVWRVHRLSYEREVGPIPAGSPVEHTCGNPSCFRPSHLRTQPAEYELLCQMIKNLVNGSIIRPFHKDKKGCINWPFHKGTNGRGLVWVKLPTGAPRRRGKTGIAARLAYERAAVEGIPVAYGIAAVERIPDGKFVCHICDNPSCIQPSHLFLGNALDNNRDCCARGRRNQCTGERHPSHKLTDAKALQIKRLRSEDRTYSTVDPLGRRYNRKYWSLERLASRFKVSKKLISGIARGERWKHIGTESV